MPRSVSHSFEGPLEGVSLRVWERRADASMHAILEGRYVHDCGDGVAHALDVETRWDIPREADPWHALALSARDRDEAAARELAHAMVTEGVESTWLDPCPG